MLVAVAVHVGVFMHIQGRSVLPFFQRTRRAPLTVTLVSPPPPAPVAPVPPPAPPEALEPPEAPAPTKPRLAPPAAPTTPAEAPATPQAPPAPATPPAMATAPPTAELPASTSPSPSLMRLPRGPGALDAVLGTGGALGISRDGLAGALDIRSDGPASDSIVAARKATRTLQEDLADDAVSAGLADDYFRTLRGRVETSWLPAVKQLNDGGERTTQLGMMKSVVEDRAAWGEMWLAYMDLAKQYANGVQPRLESQRLERLRELMRSRQGAFRVQAISEVKLTQDPSGKIQLLEFPLTSGHPGIDDGMRDAIAAAIDALPDAPPPRLHHGRSFSSWWRLRATWTMVPPTAFFSGSSFDITPRGFAVDVPFQIKLTTNVMLLRTDGRTGVEASGTDE